MRRTAIVLAAALAGGAILNLDDSRQAGNMAFGADSVQAGNVIRGMLVAKTGRTLDVRPEDERRARHIVLAPRGSKMSPKFRAFLASLVIGSEVAVAVTRNAAGRRKVNVTVLSAPGKWGKLTGTVASVGQGRLVLEDGDGKTRMFAAPHLATGPDKEMTAAIARRNVGDRVEVRWRQDDWVRVRTIRVLDISPQAAAKPGFAGGTAVGKVIKKGKDFVVIKPDQGDPQRYVLQTIAGAKDLPDKDMVTAIAAVKVGDRVEAKWFKDGDPRLYSVKPAGAAQRAPKPASGSRDLGNVEHNKVTVEYARAGGVRLMMGIYTPKKFEGKLPLVVWIAGGAWRNFWTNDSRCLPGGNGVGNLVAHGYAVASISHRLARSYNGSKAWVFPAQIEDCKGAIRFLRANAAKYSFDADRIGVWGGSSGGHLAALLGTSGGVKELEGKVGGNLKFSSRVQCVADCSGPTDLAKLEAASGGFYGPGQSPPAALVGGPTAQHKELVIKANPITYVTRDDPPFLVAHGDKDNLVPINQSEMLVNALKKAGVDVTFEVIKGVGHGRATRTQEERLNRLVTEFFDKHLKGRRGRSKATFGMKTFVYKTVGNLKIEADVYRLDDARPRPVLVWLHGGALIMGTRKWVQPDLMALCRSEGYCVVSASYRLAPQVKLPQIIEDVRDFMKWVSEKGPVLFHADASKVVVAGNSAGGYLTMMTGIIDPRPKALVAYYGYGDVDGPWYTTPSKHYRKRPLISKEDAYKGITPEVVTEPGRSGRNRRQLYRYLRQNGLWTKEVTGFNPATEKAKLDPYCPVRNITAKYPPVVMIHGTADTDVPCQESLDMAAQLKKHKVRHEMFAIPGAGHGLMGGDRKLVDKAMARAREFIKANLGSVPAGSPAATPPR